MCRRSSDERNTKGLNWWIEFQIIWMSVLEIFRKYVKFHVAKVWFSSMRAHFHFWYFAANINLFFAKIKTFPKLPFLRTQPTRKAAEPIIKHVTLFHSKSFYSLLFNAENYQCFAFQDSQFNLQFAMNELQIRADENTINLT